MRSGTTAVAALNLGRKFIGMEMEPERYELTKAKILRRKRLIRAGMRHVATDLTATWIDEYYDI